MTLRPSFSNSNLFSNHNMLVSRGYDIDIWMEKQMPEITVLGWFHTIIGILALVSGIYALAKHRVLAFSQLSGRLYLWFTLIAAITALMIFNQGGFGPAHVLGILTLLAVFAGYVMEKYSLFGRWSAFFQAISYSATFLFHMIPAITDGLRRLPVGDPIVTEFEDPLLMQFYLLFLACYVVGVFFQLRWISGRSQ